MKYSINELISKIEPICIKHNIPQAYLFGSYARNEATKNSDVDLAINSCNIHGLWNLISVKEEIKSALGMEVDVLTLAAIESEKNNPIKEEFFNNFMNERICVYEQRH